MRTKTYRGTGQEIVWVGEGSEVCALGYESDKYHFLKHRRFDAVAMGLRLGLLRGAEDCRTVWLAQDGDAGKRFDVTVAADRTALEKQLHDHLYRHTGVRSFSTPDHGWSPADYPTHEDLETKLPASTVRLLERLGVAVETRGELSEEDSKPWADALEKWVEKPGAYAHEKFVEVLLVAVRQKTFPFKVDLGAPLPRGWQDDAQGLSVKEVKSLNAALVLAHEMVYRAMLNACLHPAQMDWKTAVAPERMGLYIGCGIGAHAEQERMFLDTFRGEPTGAKTLANSIANIANGYLSGRLGMKGKISTHVGACETCLGSIADALRDLKSGLIDAALAGGFDDVMTAAAYNGFSSNQAFTTNEKLIENLESMFEESALTDGHLKELITNIRARADAAELALTVLETAAKAGQVNAYEYQRSKDRLRDEKRRVFLNLPKELSGMASMPFAKYRSGFVMGVGGGAGFFTTLERAISHGLPIRAILAAAGDMVPDSGEDGAASIAALGDGVGDAYARAFETIRRDYENVSIDSVGAWFAHGTSTPLNGWGERKEIERVHQKYGRSKDQPILITGDKAEVGHRIAGNFPSMVGYIFETNELLPVGNYLQAGFSPKGRRGFGEPLDELFPSSRVVGKAGVGQGAPVPFKGDFIAVNGAGFGRINTVLLFRRFNLDDVSMDSGARQAYEAKLRQHLDARERLKQRILFKLEPLIR